MVADTCASPETADPVTGKDIEMREETSLFILIELALEVYGTEHSMSSPNKALTFLSEIIYREASE
jgi:hypothetical protein